MREIFNRFFKKPAAIEKAPTPPDLHVGDMVEHPLRGEPTPILYIGDQIYSFVPKAYEAQFDAGRIVVGYEVIEGSPAYHKLLVDLRFVKKFRRNERSAEIDFSSDIENRTLVVPLEKLKRK